MLYFIKQSAKKMGIIIQNKCSNFEEKETRNYPLKFQIIQNICKDAPYQKVLENRNLPNIEIIIQKYNVIVIKWGPNVLKVPEVPWGPERPSVGDKGGVKCSE